MSYVEAWERCNKAAQEYGDTDQRYLNARLDLAKALDKSMLRMSKGQHLKEEKERQSKLRKNKPNDALPGMQRHWRAD